jgi:hypothetical protein
MAMSKDSSEIVKGLRIFHGRKSLIRKRIRGIQSESRSPGKVYLSVQMGDLKVL